jgi:adenosylhomocysteine nucleosidase
MRMGVEPRVLVLAPLLAEWRLLGEIFGRRYPVEAVSGLKIPCSYIRTWRVLLAQGGHGKTQCAVQAQYLIDRFASVELLVCAGAAGGLHPRLSVGDVVVATETVEHDYRQLFATRPLPRFRAHAASVARLRAAARRVSGFRVAFDVIASGDEDVVSAERAVGIRAQTGAICVAWEGSGTARAAAFNGLNSVEVRALTDAADKEAPQQFEANLPVAMANVSALLAAFFEAARASSVCG